jgi:hypothetical protein
LAYKVVLFDDGRKRELEGLGFEDAVSAISISSQTG